MKTLPLFTLFVSSLVFAGGTAPPKAPLAGIYITSILSTEVDGHRLRAVVMESNRGPSLSIERLELTVDAPTLVEQRHIKLTAARYDRVDHVRWDKSTLSFSVGKGLDHLICRVDMNGPSNVPDCVKARGGTPPPKP